MSAFLAHTAPLFVQLKILPFSKLYHYQILIFMYKIYHQLLPNCLVNMFTLNANVHHYQTRSVSAFQLPFMRLSINQKTIKFIGPKIWNMYNRVNDFSRLKTID